MVIVCIDIQKTGVNVYKYVCIALDVCVCVCNICSVIIFIILLLSSVSSSRLCIESIPTNVSTGTFWMVGLRLNISQTLYTLRTGRNVCNEHEAFLQS